MERKNKMIHMTKLFIVVFLAGLLFLYISDSYFKRICNNIIYKNSIFSIYSSNGILISPKKLYPNYLKSPKDIQRWLKNFKYQNDPDGYWKSPEETVRDKGGDCEDFASLVSRILTKLNYDNYTVAIYYTEEKERYAHAICLFEEKDETWSYFSNTDYVEIRAEYILKPIYLYYRNWYKLSFYSKDGHLIEVIHREKFERKQNANN